MPYVELERLLEKSGLNLRRYLLSGNGHAVFWDKGPYLIVFDTDAIPLGYGAPDSDLEVTWQAIDTGFPALRDIFASLDSNIGSFTLKKLYPADTSDPRSQTFYLNFQYYVPNDSVTSYLSRAPMVSFDLIWYRAETGAVRESTNSSGIQLFPDPASEELKVLVRGIEMGTPLELIDEMGRIIQTREFLPDTGIITLSLSGLPPGFYSIRIGGYQRFFVHP